MPKTHNANNIFHAKPGSTCTGFDVGTTPPSLYTSTEKVQHQTSTVLTAMMLRDPQNTNYYAVSHYKYAGTYNTYMHRSTSGSTMLKLWLSWIIPPSYRVHTLPTPRDDGTRWCMPWGAWCSVGAASGGALGLVLVYYYLDREFSEWDVQGYEVEMFVL